MNINEFTKWILKNPDLSKTLFECKRIIKVQEYIEIIKPLKENGFCDAIYILFSKSNIDNAIKRAIILFYEQKSEENAEYYSFETVCEKFEEKLFEQIEKEEIQ